MAKNPFKKGNVVDTLINVGVGGAGNVAADYLINNVEMLKSLDADTINLGKFVVGSVGSAMVSNKYAKALMDGFAVVGASNYISSLMAESQTTSGVPAGTIGRARYIAPRKSYARRFAGKTSGVPAETISNIMQ
ncbi:MAG: hypothetical protein IKL69_05440 [Paludibacteraceae bacterium]|nr:hypothetical protein [Paludibacteraceae bacterium]